ncbi:MAG: glycosyltransferase [Bacteroidetes bacterium]|nr:glycosyltransferase [Bacteroidota bacterium]
MSLILYIAFVCLALYVLVLTWLAIGFLRTKEFSLFLSKAEYPETPVTIVICARNEEKNIAFCLYSIIGELYERKNIQLILINDASTDSTVQQAERVLKNSEVDYKIISNPKQKGKKRSISYAMQFANHDLIVLRDADAISDYPSGLWLRSISEFFQKEKPDLIIAPVMFTNNIGTFWALQAIENNILALAACGSAHYKKPFLCNGANLIFTKQAFEKTQGYNSHLDIASGDDIFFLEDLKKIPDTKIAYLKSHAAIVYTYPCRSLGELLKQKIRWASKFKSNSNPLNFLLAALTFAVNALWLFCFVGLYISPLHKTLCLTFIFSKIAFDMLLLLLASKFIKNKGLLFYGIPVGFVYPIYAVIVGLASLFMKPKWK